MISLLWEGSVQGEGVTGNLTTTSLALADKLATGIGGETSWVMGLVWAHQDLDWNVMSIDTCAFFQPRVMTSEKTQNNS